jgi:hypothetical protein
MLAKPVSRPAQDENRRRLHEALTNHGMLPMVEKTVTQPSGKPAPKPAEPSSSGRPA